MTRMKFRDRGNRKFFTGFRDLADFFTGNRDTIPPLMGPLKMIYEKKWLKIHLVPENDLNIKNGRSLQKESTQKLLRFLVRYRF